MDYKIVNGTIVTAVDIYRADLGINNGKIVQIADKIKEPAADVVDAKGQYVIPGGIDIHTHLDMPFGGTVVSDDFETGTIGTKLLVSRYPYIVKGQLSSIGSPNTHFFFFANNRTTPT